MAWLERRPSVKGGREKDYRCSAMVIAAKLSQVPNGNNPWEGSQYFHILLQDEFEDESVTFLFFLSCPFLVLMFRLFVGF